MAHFADFMLEAARIDVLVAEQVQETALQLPPLTPQMAPLFDLSLALEDLLIWAVTIAARQSAKWDEVRVHMDPIFELWNDVAYIVRGQPRRVAERKPCFTTSLRDTYLTIMDLPKEERWDARVCPDRFRPDDQENFAPEDNIYYRKSWKKAFDLQWHTEQKIMVVDIASDREYRLQRAKEIRQTTLTHHFYNVHARTPDHPCIAGTCKCLEC